MYAALSAGMIIGGALFSISYLARRVSRSHGIFSACGNGDQPHIYRWGSLTLIMLSDSQVEPSFPEGKNLNPFISFDCAFRSPIRHNSRKGRDQNLQRSGAEPESFEPQGPNTYNLKIWPKPSGNLSRTQSQMPLSVYLVIHILFSSCLQVSVNQKRSRMPASIATANTPQNQLRSETPVVQSACGESVICN